MSRKIDVNKLKGMSKEEKLKLYDLLQKKKEIQKDKREAFKPNSAQLPVSQSKAKIRFFAGGNGSGKSTLLTNEHIWMAEGYNPITKEYTKVPASIAIVVDNPMKIEKVHLKELGKWFNVDKLELLKNGKPYYNEIVWPNGSRSVYYTHDQDPMIFESTEHDYILIDEPCPEHIFIGLSRGQRTKKSNARTFIVGTPLAQSWLRTKIWEPWEKGENPDLACFRGHTDANKENLAEGYIESFSRLLTEEEKRVRLSGEFWDISGLALAHLIKDPVHVIEPFPINYDWPCIVAIDPHPSKKHVAIILAIDPRTGYKYVVKEMAEKQTAKQFAMSLIEFTKGYKVIDWVCDSLGSADTTGGDGFKSFIQVLQECGIRVRATSYEEKLDEQWVERIRGALEIPETLDNFGQQTPKLRFFNTCSGIIKDVKNVAWLKYRNVDENKPKLDITHKDYLATVKYALAAATKVPTGAQPPAKKISLGSSGGGKRMSIRERYFGKRGGG